jgi:hypothetical protein
VRGACVRPTAGAWRAVGPPPRPKKKTRCSGAARHLRAFKKRRVVPFRAPEPGPAARDRGRAGRPPRPPQLQSPTRVGPARAPPCGVGPPSGRTAAGRDERASPRRAPRRLPAAGERPPCDLWVDAVDRGTAMSRSAVACAPQSESRVRSPSSLGRASAKLRCGSRACQQGHFAPCSTMPRP